jgi:hypothetical protein
MVGITIGALAAFACDSERAQTGTQSCVSNFATCSGTIVDGEGECANAYVVNQFKKPCVSAGSASTNCNTDDADCYVTTSCEPVVTNSDRCKNKSEFGQWQTRPNPETKDC